MTNLNRMPGLYVQCELECKDKDKVRLQVVWLPTEHPAVKQDGVVWFKEDPRVWTIVRMFTTLDRKHLDKRWKVGGLE